MGQSQLVGQLAGRLLGAPSELPALEDVTQIAPGVLRVLGQNPGPATLQGTNTYVVGTGARRALVDTSDGNGRWWRTLKRVLEQQGARVSDILLTHRHSPDIRRPEAASGRFAARAGGSAGGRWRCACCGRDGEVPADSLDLREGSAVRVGGASLRAMLTPGHSSDSACFSLEVGEEAAAILTGDTLLGGTSAVFDDLRAYRTSLQRLRGCVRERPGGALLLPGHGAAVPAGSAGAYVSSALGALSRREVAVLEVRG
ncbi:unnamed protein product [Prorocentrum cordatum]|uniref:Metallo-beta-lactamase domain-containing protein n=1 Tax=Prorocentrum cordatum TaxID=2364126 RepID=A0ABN9RGP7_9DINO|nr:unnamed protein product [Polarella glacialis]